jgi:NADH:ubiquinone oxidoreductase subunit K
MSMAFWSIISRNSRNVLFGFLAAAADERAVGVNLVIDIRRKRTEANMIASPAWMLEGRTFTAATSAAHGGP